MFVTRSLRRARPQTGFRPSRIIAIVAAVALSLGTAVAGAGTATAADAPNAVLSLDKSTVSTTVSPGETMVWELKIGCESLETICIDAALHDTVPVDFDVTDVRVIGAKQNSTVKVGDRDAATGTAIDVVFNESSDRFPGIKGIEDGQKLSVLISSRLRDATVERNGATVTNSGQVSAKNALTVVDDASVTLKVDPKTAVDVTKKWSSASQIADPAAINDLTLTIKNSSTIPASTLKLVDPKGIEDSAGTVVNPFDYVEFTGFGAFALPEGAATVAVTALSGGATYTAPPAATPSLPTGVTADKVTGLVFTFASATGQQIVAQGAAGSVVIHTKQRTSVSTSTLTNVNNTAFGTVTTADDTATNEASASFVINPLAVKVTASKSFGTTGDLLAGASTSVTVAGSNDSNVPLSSLTLTEPAPGLALNPFPSRLVFNGFGTAGDGNITGGDWPTGATEALVTYQYSDGQVSSATVASLKGWPAPTAGKTVVGFTVKYTGAIAPKATAKIPFAVTTVSGTSGTIINQVQVDGIGAPGAADPKVASAELKVVAPSLTSSTSKALSAGTNVAGQEIVATLKGKYSGTVKANELVITDSVLTTTSGNNLWNAFTASRVSGVTVPDGMSLQIQTTTNGTSFVDLGKEHAAKSVLNETLPAGTKGVRFIFTTPLGTYLSANTDLIAKIVFTLPEAQQQLTWNNCATSSASGDHGVKSTPAEACKSVTLGTGVQPNPVLSQSTNKSWSTSPLLIPNDLKNGAYPTSDLTLTTKNTSDVTATKITLADATKSTNPFDYLDITKLTVSLPSGAVDATTEIELFSADGTKVHDFSGSTAKNAASALTKDQLKNVTEIRVSSEGLFAKNAELKVVATTQLRPETRAGGIPITAAAKAANWSVNNTATGMVSDGISDIYLDAPKPIGIVPAADAPLNAKLGKAITPNTDTVYSAAADRKYKVSLDVAKTEGAPTVIVVTDDTPTFWNAFTFAGLTSVSGVSTKSADYVARIDYLTSRVFSTDAQGKLTASAGTWVDGAEFPVAADGSLNADQKALPSGIDKGDVSGIRITYTAKSGSWGTPDKNGFSGQRTTFDVSPRHFLRSTEPTSDTGSAKANPNESAPGVVTNTVTGTITDGLRNDPKAIEPATATFSFTPGAQKIVVDKTPNTSAVVPGEEIPFKLKMENKGSTPLVNPVFTDVIPWDAKGALLQYNPASYTPASYSATPDGASITTDSKRISVVTTDFPDADYTKARTEIVFTFPAGTRILPGETYTVTLPMKVRAGVERNTIFDNTYKLTADGGFSATDKAQITVLEGGSYGRIKDVKENLGKGDAPTGLFHTLDGTNECIDDGGFYRVPCLVETKPGGTETWRLRVINTGNLPTTSMTMVDVFPKAGDTGTSKALSSLSRGSMWTPIFEGGIEYGALPKGTETTLWFQTDAQKTCVLGGVPDSADPFGTTCAPGQWIKSSSTDLSELKDPSVVTAIKLTFDFPTLLQPGEQVEVTYQTRTPDELPKGVPAYTDGGAPTPAWNSFVVFTTTQKDSGPDYETLEPNKAGIAFATPVAVGDYVWVDADRDGVQDDNEPPLEGVKVTLLDSADTEVGSATTDADGRYLFDELWPGDYTVQFELTSAQKAKYRFTGEGEGDDRAFDSNANASTGRTGTFHLDASDAKYPEMIARADYTGGKLKALYIDPTIDAGVIPSAVSVGDYVWLDENRDGIQDAAESGIEGVVLTLIGPDGKAVRDIYGDTVGSTTTDADGWYGFSDLPILEENEAYTVRIDYLASAMPLFGLFQSPTGEGTTETDSSRDFSVSTDLATDGASDESLDFGFYAADLETFPLPDEPGELETLAMTGGAIGGGLLLLGGLLTGGLLLILIGRKPRGSHS